jgi:hypothetical protein
LSGIVGEVCSTIGQKHFQIMSEVLTENDSGSNEPGIFLPGLLFAEKIGLCCRNWGQFCRFVQYIEDRVSSHELVHAN